jgi:hypothetical protein
MGYQYGYLLVDRITDLASGFLTPVYSMFGGWEPDGVTPPTPEQWELGRMWLYYVASTYFEPVIMEKAPEYYEEMQGVMAGLAAAGSPVSWEDVLIFNCIPEVLENMFFGGGCSDCIVWGKATKNRGLIHGSNFDFETFNCLHKDMVVAVYNPERGLVDPGTGLTGHAFLGACIPGIVGTMRSINDVGITEGEPTSNSIDRDIIAHPEIPHLMHMRKVIQYSSSIQDAIRIMEFYGGTTGWNIVVADGKARYAADIEVSCNHMGVVYPMEGVDALWSTNQYVAYPGYQGYPLDGYNMVKDQMAWWGVPWEEVDTIEKWVAYLTAERWSTWGRYEKLRELINANYGNIDIRKVMEFMSTYPLSRTPTSIQLAPECEQMYGFVRPIITMELASVLSVVFDTRSLTAWVALGAEPAQAGTYWPINLPFHLLLMQIYAIFN